MITTLIISQVLSWLAICFLIRLYIRAGGLSTWADFKALLRPRTLFVSFDEHNYPSAEYIIQTVCLTTGVLKSDILSSTRLRNVVEARYIAIYLCCVFCDRKAMTLAKIGYAFNRDHTTIIYAADKVRDLMDVYPDYKTKVDDIKDKIFNGIKNKKLYYQRFTVVHLFNPAIISLIAGFFCAVFLASEKIIIKKIKNNLHY